MAPQLQVCKGGWVASAEGLAVFASTGQEALLRFEVARRRAGLGDDAQSEVIAQMPYEVVSTGSH